MEIEKNNAQDSGSRGNSANASGRNENGDYKFIFHGSNTQYLGLVLYNLLLTVITLGIYYPWAKCAIRKFLWQETEIDGSRFEWHGTGKEMFRGFIKAYAIIGVFLFILNFGNLFIPPKILIWLVIISYLFIIAILPLVIHGMMRYRLSRTSLRGIHFGYRGDLKEFYKKTTLDFLYTLLSFGIYGSWLQVNIRKYLMRNSRYGNVSGLFNATGGDLLLLSIGQGILVAITLYIYLPWAIIRFFKFYIESTKVVQNDQVFHLKTNANGGRYFLLIILAAIITLGTLGICAPIAKLIIHKYLTNSISLSSGFNFNAVEQTEEAFTDASSDDMADILDFDF